MRCGTSWKEGIDTRVQTAITMGQVAGAYIPRRAIPSPRRGARDLRCRRRYAVFSTDTVGAQRALEIKVRCGVDEQNGVDRVYGADPPSGRTVRQGDLRGAAAWPEVVDATSFSLCMENGIDMVVFRHGGASNNPADRAVRGERIGTLVYAD